MRNIAVILPAAGSGRRFGGERPKQFHRLAGVPVLEHTLRFFLKYPGIAEIVLAVPACDVAWLSRRLANRPAPPTIQIVRGGKTRQESVARAMGAVKKACAWVVVHDVVRPFLDRRLFAALLQCARRSGAAIPGLQIVDTLKKVTPGGMVIETVPRDRFVQVQTPQVFRREILQEALRAAARDNYTGTDESMLVERLGLPVRVVPGMRRNIKITVPEDLGLAEWLYGRRWGIRK